MLNRNFIMKLVINTETNNNVFKPFSLLNVVRKLFYTKFQQETPRESKQGMQSVEITSLDRNKNK